MLNSIPVFSMFYIYNKSTYKIKNNCSSIIAFIHQLIHISTYYPFLNASTHPFDNPSIHPVVCSIVHPSIPPILSLISLYLSATISYLPIHLTYLLSAYLHMQPLAYLPAYLPMYQPTIWQSALPTCLLTDHKSTSTHLAYLLIYLSCVPIYSHHAGDSKVTPNQHYNRSIVREL